jgi:hypothetical protein
MRKEAVRIVDRAVHPEDRAGIGILKGSSSRAVHKLPRARTL